MPSVTRWTGPTTGFSAFHLDEENLGSEDGALDGSSFNYNWTVGPYCIHTAVGVPVASDLSCGSDPGSLKGQGPLLESRTFPNRGISLAFPSRQD